MNISKFRIRNFLTFLLLFVFVFSGITIFIYWMSEKRGEAVWADRVKNRALIVARAGAMSISSFLSHRGDKLLIMADVPAIQEEWEEEGRAYLQKMVDQLQDYPLTSIVRVNKEGIVIWSENKYHQSAEEFINVSDRNYFLWAKTQGKPGEIYLGEPIIARTGPSKGEEIIVMATPIFNKGVFNGLLFISAPLDELTTKFVAPLLESSPDARVMIIAGNGNTIASTDQDYLGKDVNSLFERDEGRMLETFGEKEGVAVGRFFQNPDDSWTKDIVGYAPILRKGGNWSLWVVLPYSDALDLFWPTKINIMTLYLLIFAGGLIVCTAFVLGLRVAQTEGFFDGYFRGKKETAKKE